MNLKVSLLDHEVLWIPSFLDMDPTVDMFSLKVEMQSSILEIFYLILCYN